MPSTIRLSKTSLLTAVRRRQGLKRCVETWRSGDDGKTWKDPTKVGDTGVGNPPSMIRLADGRICITYVYRAAPFGIRASLSDDQGRTWGKEIILRDDGGGQDLGYPRTVQRPDGKIVTIYYFHDELKSERYIAATIWTP